VLMVDSRADRDIDISLDDFVGAGEGLCRNLRRESQGSPARRLGPSETLFVVPAKSRDP
jgi:hypothetical protein